MSTHIKSHSWARCKSTHVPDSIRHRQSQHMCAARVLAVRPAVTCVRTDGCFPCVAKVIYWKSFWCLFFHFKDNDKLCIHLLTNFYWLTWKQKFPLLFFRPLGPCFPIKVGSITLSHAEILRVRQSTFMRPSCTLKCSIFWIPQKVLYLPPPSNNPDYFSTSPKAHLHYSSGRWPVKLLTVCNGGFQ